MKKVKKVREFIARCLQTLLQGNLIMIPIDANAVIIDRNPDNSMLSNTAVSTPPATPEKAPRSAVAQALVEYALILAMLMTILIVMFELTGDAIGNVFDNVVYNAAGADRSLATPISDRGGSLSQFQETYDWVLNNPQGETPYPIGP